MTVIKVLKRWLFCLWKMEKGYISVIKKRYKSGPFVHILCVQKAYKIWTFIPFQKFQKIHERCKKVHKRWPFNHLLACIKGVFSCSGNNWSDKGPLKYSVFITEVYMVFMHIFSCNTQVLSSDIITSLCWVLFRKWGMKGVCLRKRWGKCYMRCIVKFNFLAFFKWTCYCVHCWVSIWNTTYTEKYLTSRYN